MKNLLVFILLAASAQAASLGLIFSDNTVTVGETFTVTVRLLDPFANNQGDPLLGFGFDHTISPAGPVTIGTISFVAPFESFAGGANYVGGTALPFIEDLGQSFIDLVVLTFQAVAPGVTQVGVNATGDPNFYGIAYLSASTQIAALSEQVVVTAPVAPVPPSGGADVPEPATVVMMGAGLLAVVALRKRR